MKNSKFCSGNFARKGFNQKLFVRRLSESVLLVSGVPAGKNCS